MADTPFISSLTDEQKALVARRSRGAKRPSYYSATLARANQPVPGLTTAPSNPDDVAKVQITEDLEALLILMPIETKRRLIEFIKVVVPASTTEDDLALMTEVVAVRAKSYAQVNADVGAHLSRYDETRASVVSMLASAAPAEGVTDPLVALVPDLSNLFTVLKEDHSNLSQRDLLAAHDRITDAATLYGYTDSGIYRMKELLSWVVVISTYLS